MLGVRVCGLDMVVGEGVVSGWVSAVEREGRGEDGRLGYHVRMMMRGRRGGQSKSRRAFQISLLTVTIPRTRPGMHNDADSSQSPSLSQAPALNNRHLAPFLTHPP